MKENYVFENFPLVTPFMKIGRFFAPMTQTTISHAQTGVSIPLSSTIRLHLEVHLVQYSHVYPCQSDIFKLSLYFRRYLRGVTFTLWLLVHFPHLSYALGSSSRFIQYISAYITLCILLFASAISFFFAIQYNDY